MKRSKHSKGFTLIELLAVISIIGILAALTLISVSRAKRRAHITKANAEMRELIRAWRTYWVTYETWPASFQGQANVEMTAENLTYLLGDNDGDGSMSDSDEQHLHFIELGADATSKGMKDPWGKYYLVDFSKIEETEGTDIYEATVSFPLQRRYIYDDL
jgi:prepilin-type N-terminal cleavage/methylation domain-containing protein